MDELDGSHVQAAGGLAGDEDPQVPGQLAGEDRLLLVAARQGRDGVGDVGDAHVELLAQPLGVGADPGGAQGRTGPESRVVVAVEDHVLGHGEVGDHAAGGAVLRHEAQARPQAPVHAEAGDVALAEADGSGRRPGQAQDHLPQLGLAVALDPGHAEDLAGGHLETDVVEQDGAVGHQAHALQDQAGAGGAGRGLVDAQGDVVAHHESRELARRGGGIGGAHDGAAADDGDRVRHLADLAQLVGDEDDGGARGPEVAHDPHELVGLLGGEHGGGLVEDEHPGLAGQGLDDLHALLDADGQVLDAGGRVDVEAEALGDLADPGGRGRGVDDPHRPDRLVAQGHGLGDGEDRHQHEVLVDHADPGGHGVARPGEGHGLAVDEDLALVRPVQAVQDVHEGGLAGAVLAQQGVDLTGLDGEVDVVVGHERPEGLRDPA